MGRIKFNLFCTNLIWFCTGMIAVSVFEHPTTLGAGSLAIASAVSVSAYNFDINRIMKWLNP